MSHISLTFHEILIKQEEEQELRFINNLKYSSFQLTFT